MDFVLGRSQFRCLRALLLALAASGAICESCHIHHEECLSIQPEETVLALCASCKLHRPSSPAVGIAKLHMVDAQWRRIVSEASLFLTNTVGLVLGSAGVVNFAKVQEV